MPKVFIDTDVILDCFLVRERFYQASAALLSLGENKKINAYTSVIVVSNLYYMLQKQYNHHKAISILRKLSTFIEILSINSEIIKTALISDSKDFEDTIQYFCAKENKLDYIITRNKKDFPNSEISVLSPIEFLTEH